MGEERGGERIVRLSEKLRGAGIALIGFSINLHRLKLRIDNPILRNTVMFIELALDYLIGLPGLFGKDFNNEVRRPLYVFFSDDGCPLSGNEENVRLNDIAFGEDNVAGGDKNLPDSGTFQKVSKEGRYVQSDSLMLGRRRGSHKVFSFNDLMALSILREEEIIFVGEMNLMNLR